MSFIRCILLWLCLFASSSFAFHAETNTIASPLTERIQLQQVYYLTTSADMTMAQLLDDPSFHHSFRLLTPAERVLFNGDDAVWLFTRLQNPGSRALDIVLEYDFPLADKVEIYQLNSRNKDARPLSRAGTDYPFSERSLAYRSFAVSLQLKPDEQTDIFLKVQDAAVIPSELLLWSHSSFVANKQRQALLDGVVQGLLLLLAMYNLMLYLRSRSKHYLYYAGFFFGFALVVAVLNGMAFMLLWPDYPELNQAMLYIAAGSALLCLNQFVSQVVQDAQNNWWRRCSALSNIIALLLLFSPLFANGQLRLALLFVCVGWVLGSNLLLALTLSLQGRHQARSFIWACVLTLIAALLLTLNQAGYLHAGINWSYILFSLVMLSLALTSFNLQRFFITQDPGLTSNAELQHYHDVFHNAVEGMFTTTLDGKLLNANRALLHILGYKSEDELKQAISQTGMARFYADPADRQFMLQQLQLGGKKSFEMRGLRGDNSPFWALMSVRLSPSKQQHQAFIHGSVIDITEQKLAHEQLAYLASHDALTALYNRYYFEQQLLHLSQQGTASGCIIFIDIDQFKLVNVSCSHQAGDVLLKQLSEQFKRTLAHHGPLARLDGDEFAILLTDSNSNEAFSLAYRLLDTAREYRFIWQDSIYPITVSIGVAEISKDDSPDSMLKKAEAACHLAKDKGRNRIQLFDTTDKDSQRLQNEAMWVRRLRQAIEDNQFVLYQQTILPLRTADLPHSYEILLRLRADDDTLITPASFLTSAESYGLMPQIDRWVIKNYFRWLQRQPGHLQQLELCSINLSACSLQDAGFKDDVQLMFDRYQIPFSRICFEITESVAIVNLQSTLAFITHFRALGCKIALDDFGSGFSSYSYLKHFPADFVKIDGHFVRDLLDDQYDRAIVKSIHDVARAMGMQTVAEFVETDDILNAVKLLGIDYVQGYAVAKPQPLTNLLAG